MTTALSHNIDRSASTMCQYRYYYYGGCRHSETVLFEFCEEAAPAAAVVATAAPALASETLRGKHLPSPTPSQYPLRQARAMRRQSQQQQQQQQQQRSDTVGQA